MWQSAGQVTFSMKQQGEEGSNLMMMMLNIVADNNKTDDAIIRNGDTTARAS